MKKEIDARLRKEMGMEMDSSIKESEEDKMKKDIDARLRREMGMDLNTSKPPCSSPPVIPTVVTPPVNPIVVSRNPMPSKSPIPCPIPSPSSSPSPCPIPSPSSDIGDPSKIKINLKIDGQAGSGG